MNRNQKAKSDPFVPKADEVRAAIAHTVYEYANLVSAGTRLHSPLDPPLNTHLQDAFILSCRKLADFFEPKRSKDDVKAGDFCSIKGVPTVPRDTWIEWKCAVDKQLAHLTYTRVNAPKEWNASMNLPLLHEFQNAFRLFLGNVDPDYEADFREHMAERSLALKVPLP